jgi:hypothetical protein
MKRAVSISIGSSKRNKAVTINLLGEEISIERIGTDGDMEAAALKYKELDGKVDAFGVGGGDLGALVDGKWYPFYSVKPMVRFVEKTPLVDGTGLKNSLEARAAAFLDEKIGGYINELGRRAFLPVGIDRWGMSSCFPAAGYETRYGDLLFGIDVPIILSKTSQLKTMAALLMPIVGRLPFEWIYPLGEKQENAPRKARSGFAGQPSLPAIATILNATCPTNCRARLSLPTPPQPKMSNFSAKPGLSTSPPVRRCWRAVPLART